MTKVRKVQSKFFVKKYEKKLQGSKKTAETLGQAKGFCGFWTGKDLKKKNIGALVFLCPTTPSS